jgi:hypothetical protein
MPDTGHFTIISGPADADWDTCPRCLGRGHYFGISTIFKIRCDRCRGAGILGCVPELIDGGGRTVIAPWKPGPAELPRRVHDLVQGHFGTAVEYVAFSARGHFYRVEWDNPTPHQDTATPLIPSQHFEWAEPAPIDGQEAPDGR